MPARKREPHSIGHLKTQLSYDEIRGIFRWLVDRGLGGCRGRVGDIANDGVSPMLEAA